MWTITDMRALCVKLSRKNVFFLTQINDFFKPKNSFISKREKTLYLISLLIVDIL